MLHVTSQLVVRLAEVETLVKRGVKNLLTRVFKEGWHSTGHFWLAPFEILQLNNTCWGLGPWSPPLRATTCRPAATLKNPLVTFNLRFWLGCWRAFLETIQLFNFGHFLRANLFLDPGGIGIYAPLGACSDWHSLKSQTLLSWLHESSTPCLR